MESCSHKVLQKCNLLMYNDDDNDDDYNAIPKIIWAKVCNRQTDRQTNSFTPYTGECGYFILVKFATSHLLCSQRDKITFCIKKIQFCPRGISSLIDLGL